MTHMTDDTDRAVVQTVERELLQWMHQVRKNTAAVPTTVFELRQVRHRIQEASAILRTHGQRSETPEWKEALASYKQILMQLQAFAREFEINLRIRRAELGAACGRAHATSEWAAAVKRLG